MATGIIAVGQLTYWCGLFCATEPPIGFIRQPLQRRGRSLRRNPPPLHVRFACCSGFAAGSGVSSPAIGPPTSGTWSPGRGGALFNRNRRPTQHAAPWLIFRLSGRRPQLEPASSSTPHFTFPFDPHFRRWNRLYYFRSGEELRNPFDLGWRENSREFFLQRLSPWPPKARRRNRPFEICPAPREDAGREMNAFFVR